VNFEVVTVVSSAAELTMLHENFLDRQMDMPLTVLARPAVQLPPHDRWSIHTVPIGPTGLVEKAMQEYASRARSPWLLQVDPDERWPDEAFQRASELTRTLDESEAASFPMTYFVGSRPLRGGPWSGHYFQRLNSRSSVMRSSGEVHTAPPASRVERIALARPVEHYWVRDLAELRAKADNYLRREGKARIAKLGPYRPYKAALQVSRATVGSIYSRPWKDGSLGIRLVAEMIRYECKANAAWRAEPRVHPTSSGP
jgi:hypothetical protein